LDNKQHLIINGSGSYSGGMYNKVKIRGEGMITTDFECDDFKTFGTSDILKNGKAGKFSVFGETDVRGNLQCEDVKVYGTLSIGGSADFKKTQVRGTLDIQDRFTGEVADIKGGLTVKGDAEFERFHSSGAFEIDGLLNAGEINISLRFATSHANEIGGEKIIVKRKSGFIPFTKGEGILEVGLVEGDEIFLENTIADVVRGKSVHIGRGCKIGLVEYQDHFKTDEDAHIKDSKKL
jgi:cytoskeletal protein CcmA (bactofilin family)